LPVRNWEKVSVAGARALSALGVCPLREVLLYTISESSSVGTVLAPTLLATDGDEGTNGQVRYSISTGPFNVDENTGIIM